MFYNFCKLLMLIIVITSCNSVQGNKEIAETDTVSTETLSYSIGNLPLTGNGFKVPLPQGYDWEITQSWEKHCEYCNSKGYDKVDNGYFGNYCQLSHSTADPNDYGCFEYCKFGWDFNLSGNDDLGKSVLASGDGVVLEAKDGKENGKYKGGGWGNTVVIDHGNNICSRYSHMKDGSVTLSKYDQVCQGLKIGEVGDTPSVGAHLHFQFEDCNTHKPLEMGFTDGNGVPKCVMGSDRYTDGVYTALMLTNVEKSYCAEEDLYQKDTEPTIEEAKVCDLQCPLNQKCGQNGKVPFDDINDSDTSHAVDYLWRECAVSGKDDGNFHPYDTLTRAEALKITLVLFGLDKGCEGNVQPFSDVSPLNWFHAYVVCGVKYGIISTETSSFNPNQNVYFSEAAKMAVMAAVKAKKAEMKTGMYAKFTKLKNTDWSYKYLQTIAYYNGIDENLLKKDTTYFLLRGEYARMVAALSPCNCFKNKCKGGCECDQSNYLCKAATVSKEKSPDSGKYGGGADKPDIASFSASSGKDASDSSTQKDVCEPVCQKQGKLCGPDGCGGNCGICPSDKFCNQSSGKCQDPCAPQGCSELNCECGLCPFDKPGCPKGTLSCGSCTNGQTCNNNKCSYPSNGKVCNALCKAGQDCGSDGCGGNCGICPNDKFCNFTTGKCLDHCFSNGCSKLGCECGQCTSNEVGPCNGNIFSCGECAVSQMCNQNHKCVPDPCYNCPAGQCIGGKCLPKTVINCDPAKGYNIYFNTDPGKSGKWESFTSPIQKYYSGNFLTSLSLHYDCAELPAMLLLSNFTGNGVVWMKDETLPAFMFWPDYMGPIISSPPSKGNSMIAKFMSFPAGSKLLLKIPYN